MNSHRLSWDHLREVAYDLLSLPILLLVLYTLIRLYPTGWWGAREPSRYVLIPEIVLVAALMLLGVERLIKDLKEKT